MSPIDYNSEIYLYKLYTFLRKITCSTNNNTEPKTRNVTPIPTPGQGLGKIHPRRLSHRRATATRKQLRRRLPPTIVGGTPKRKPSGPATWRVSKKEKGEEEEDTNRCPSTPQVIQQPPNIETPPKINFPPFPSMSWTLFYVSWT